jgi:hypothetical protein
MAETEERCRREMGEEAYLKMMEQIDMEMNEDTEQANET